ncbi:hypothetical protein [Haloechinothrix sp. LS1_15]|uniref:hypothetical protein n=1 Tax=Haloechinothrix sp. LS1_15 TaxID=2652248 RepID=UPI002947FB85|nr:hypothetical protein [Haloechinothrix sp. LS1_15]MDV6011263.1 DUF3558 domain-containing protein [Haloechinothrix sp. LS1_15]
MRASLKIGLLVAVLGLLLAGCGQEEGTAEPERAEVPGAQDGAGVEDGLLALDACQVLDAAVEGEGFEPGEPPDIRGDHACHVSKPREIDVPLGFQEGPFDVLQGDPDKMFEGEVNGREAILIRESLEGGGGGQCDISMKVGESERALVLVTKIDRDTDGACEDVERIAEQVEPQLPGSEQ